MSSHAHALLASQKVYNITDLFIIAKLAPCTETNIPEEHSIALVLNIPISAT